jgi:cellulose synthase/poly-beta-1,6-N-acetylglucosamine synthase-like glycosyltransferase
MWTLATFVYWVSLLTVGYTYFGYPFAILLLSKLRHKSIEKAPTSPTVSVIVAARNEAKCIRAKIENLLTMDYPREKVQIIVVSDGSTDGTDDVVRNFAAHGVVLLSLDRPNGKAAAINQAVRLATGDVLMFCDARQLVDSHAMTALVGCLADSTVGSVSGELYLDDASGPGAYWKYEKAIRHAESKFDSVPGVTGALHATRRELFCPIPADLLLDDMFTPLQIVMQGYRVVFEPAAKAYDREVDAKNEFRRKARTLAGNYQLLAVLPGLLNPMKNRIFWQFFSHKVLRLVCPFALLSLLAANVILALRPAPEVFYYWFTLVLQLSAYGLAALGAWLGSSAVKVARIAYTFVMMNAAAVEGLRRYLKGDFTWTRAST